MRDGDSAAKILSVVLLCAVLAPCSGCMWDLPGSISYVDGKYVDSEAGKKRGVVADWRVAPFQTIVGCREDERPLYLFDGEPHCIMIFTPFFLDTRQHSGIISLTGISSRLEYNFGIFCGMVPEVKNNYGILCGLGSNVKHNYGAQIGFLNFNFPIHVQICGVNFADCVRVGLVNHSSNRECATWLDIGLVNDGSATGLQIGILNHNEKSPIPYLPIFNFCPDSKDDL